MELLLSDVDNFSESSSSVDQDDVEFIYGEQARTILSSLEEAIGKIDDFLSFEQGFMLGDIVCSMADPSGQIGRVVNVDMIVDLENVYGDKIKNINSRNLQKLRSISMGDYVVYGQWLGKVNKLIDRVTILFDDGTKSELTSVSHEKLVPVSPDLLEDSQYPYYPGQRVRVVGFSSLSKSSGWLCGRQKEKQDEGTVCDVDAGVVYVEWLGCAVAGCERVPTPQSMLDAKNLTMLPCFLHAKWQVGDWCTLCAADGMTVLGQTLLNSPSCELIKGRKLSGKIFQREGRTSNFQEMFIIMKTKTKIDVLWQDGTQSLGLDSQSLFPVNTVDPHDFLPGQFVLERGTCDDPHFSSIQRWGVVGCMDAKERTAKVKWYSPSTQKALNLEAQWTEETVSSYELVEHVDYAFSVADAVFRMEKNQFKALSDGTSCENETIKKFHMGQGAECNGVVHFRDQKECLSTSYLSSIGIVMGFKDGDVEVKWVTGLETKVAPYEIFRMDKYEGSTTTAVLHVESVEESSDEIAQNGSQSLGQMELFDFVGGAKDSENNWWDSSSFNLPHAAIRFLTNVAASLFGSLGSKTLSGTSVRIGVPREEEESLELSSLYAWEKMLVLSDLKNSAKTDSEHKVKGTEEVEDLHVSTCSKLAEEFRQLDMVNDCSDHHFSDGAGRSLTLAQVTRGWLKKVQQEWSILQNDLPETIYVRIYEERMDLLRAAVVGAPGTPYHDNLFFFDILLPPEYPLEPPLVHYNSCGLRVNPNLYESGRVCLSLLNTWTGTGNEVWNPEHSTILQVLLSIQALVLNEKPYFNEAGFDKQKGKAEGEKNSLTYNENAFLLSCKSMLYLLRKPPKHFETLVEEHFKQHCKDILLACKAYMEGAPVGFAFGYGKSENGIVKGSSTGFKIMLAKLYPKLVEAFSCEGIDCQPICGTVKITLKPWSSVSECRTAV